MKINSIFNSLKNKKDKPSPHQSLHNTPWPLPLSSLPCCSLLSLHLTLSQNTLRCYKPSVYRTWNEIQCIFLLAQNLLHVTGGEKLITPKHTICRCKAEIVSQKVEKLKTIVPAIGIWMNYFLKIVLFLWLYTDIL